MACFRFPDALDQMTSNPQAGADPRGFLKSQRACHPRHPPAVCRLRTPIALSPVACYTMGRRVLDSPAQPATEATPRTVHPFPWGTLAPKREPSLPARQVCPGGPFCWPGARDSPEPFSRATRRPGCAERCRTSMRNAPLRIYAPVGTGPCWPTANTRKWTREEVRK
jgi:hypothetical protein